MYRLLLFLKRIYLLVLFLGLEGLALHYYAHSTAHTRANLLDTSSRIVGGVYGAFASVEDYFSLGRTNRVLEDRLQVLENEVSRLRLDYVDSLSSDFPLEYVVGRVVRNTTNKRENYLMVDRGSADGVERGMAVVSPDGFMVGYVEGVSERNSICVSVLNTGFTSSGMLATSGHFGSITWRGESPRMVRLSEVPDYAEVSRGDTIVTSGYSFAFPEGIGIGRVESIHPDAARASYEIDVRLGVDIAALRVVVLIKNPAVYERIRLTEEVLGEVEN